MITIVFELVLTLAHMGAVLSLMMRGQWDLPCMAKCGVVGIEELRVPIWVLVDTHFCDTRTMTIKCKIRVPFTDAVLVVVTPFACYKCDRVVKRKAAEHEDILELQALDCDMIDAFISLPTEYDTPP